MNVALAAEESAGLRALELLAGRDDVRVVLVLSSGRGASASVADAAVDRGLRVEPASSVADAGLAEELRGLEVDLLLNVHSLSIAHADVVDAPRLGSFNLHPGPLPSYAGLNAPSWAVYEGATEYAVTLHWMSAAVDAGPIAYSRAVTLSEEDTGLTVMARCVRAGIPLLSTLLDQASRRPDRVPRLPQSTSPIDRGPGPPNRGRVDWTQSARQLAAFVRACDYGPFPSPWGRPHTAIGDDELGLVQARLHPLEGLHYDEPGTVLAIVGDAIAVATGADALLVSRVARAGETLSAAAIASVGTRFAA